MHAKNQEMIKQIYRMSKVYVLVKMEEKMHLASRLFISTLDKGSLLVPFLSNP